MGQSLTKEQLKDVNDLEAGTQSELASLLIGRSIDEPVTADAVIKMLAEALTKASKSNRDKSSKPAK